MSQPVDFYKRKTWYGWVSGYTNYCNRMDTTDTTAETLDRVLDTRTWNDDSMDVEEEDKNEKENPDDYFQVPVFIPNKDQEFSRRIGIFGGVLKEILERIDKPIRLKKHWSDLLKLDPKATTLATPFDRNKHVCVVKAVEACMEMIPVEGPPYTSAVSRYVEFYWQFLRPHNQVDWFIPNVNTWQELDALLSQTLPCVDYLNSKLFDLSLFLELTQFWTTSSPRDCATALLNMMHGRGHFPPRSLYLYPTWIQWPRVVHLVTDPEVLQYILQTKLLSKQQILNFLVQHPQALHREDILKLLEPSVADIDELTMRASRVTICFNLPSNLVDEWLQSLHKCKLWELLWCLLENASSQATADAARPIIAKASQILSQYEPEPSDPDDRERWSDIREQHAIPNWYEPLLTEYFPAAFLA